MTTPATLNVTIYQGQDFNLPPFRILLKRPEEVLTSGGMVTIPGIYGNPQDYTFASQFRAENEKGRVEASGDAVLAFTLTSEQITPTMSAAVTARMTAETGSWDMESTHKTTGRVQKLYRGKWTLIPESTKDAP